MISTQTPVEIRMFAWARPRKGMTLEDLEDHLQKIGNEIIEVDKENNRIKIADVTEKL